MDYQTMSEIKEYKQECAMSNLSVEVQKSSFERSLKNGLGEQMLNELTHPPKPNNWLKIRLRFVKFFEKLNFLLNIKRDQSN